MATNQDSVGKQALSGLQIAGIIALTAAHIFATAMLAYLMYVVKDIISPETYVDGLTGLAIFWASALLAVGAVICLVLGTMSILVNRKRYSVVSKLAKVLLCINVIELAYLIFLFFTGF